MRLPGNGSKRCDKKTMRIKLHSVDRKNVYKINTIIFLVEGKGHRVKH